MSVANPPSTKPDPSAHPAWASRPTASTSSTRAERKGTPAQLFWPWCASNVSVLAVSYGAFVLGLRAQPRARRLVAAVVGAVLSFLLVGLVSIAGKRGSAPTLVLSRAAFGRHGNVLPGAVSYLLLVGWETVLVSLATFATATVFGRLGWGDGNLTKVVAFLVVAAIIVVAGILGFDAIMRLQKWLTVAMVAATVVYIALTVDHVDLGAAGALPAGGTSAAGGRHHPGDHRLRRGLGELRGRLLPLPAPHGLHAAASSPGPPSAAACPS